MGTDMVKIQPNGALKSIGQFIGMVATTVGLLLGLLGFAKPFIESRISEISYAATERALETERARVEQIARRIAEAVIEENVPRAHEIARRVAREEVEGHSKERRRELDQVHAAMIRLTDEVRQMRDELRALRADVRDN